VMILMLMLKAMVTMMVMMMMMKAMMTMMMTMMWHLSLSPNTAQSYCLASAFSPSGCLS